MDITNGSNRLARKGRRALKRQAAAERRPTELPVTFNPKFLDNADGRLQVVRTIRKKVEQLMQDAGGNESTQRAMLVKHTAFLHILLETFETEMAESGRLDLGQFIQATNSLVGLLRMLGLEKRMKNAGTTLNEYVEEKDK